MSGRAAKCSTGCSSAPPQEPTLFGFDFSFAPPFVERGAYLPGEAGVPDDARAFWAYVDRHAPDEDLGAASFLEQVHRRHFYFGIADGVKADFVHFRHCDAALNAAGGRKTASAYDAIGAAQVAKASFSGMRLLHHLDGRVAIWPMDPLAPGRSAVVEIYTRIYIRNAGLPGKKIRTAAELDAALIALGSKPAPARPCPDRPPDRRAGHRRGHARAPRPPARLRPRRPHPRHRAHRRLDVRRHLTIKAARVPD